MKAVSKGLPASGVVLPFETHFSRPSTETRQSHKVDGLFSSGTPSFKNPVKKKNRSEKYFFDPFFGLRFDTIIVS
jgi:hypothetical protein